MEVIFTDTAACVRFCVIALLVLCALPFTALVITKAVRGAISPDFGGIASGEGAATVLGRLIDQHLREKKVSEAADDDEAAEEAEDGEEPEALAKRGKGGLNG